MKSLPILSVGVLLLFVLTSCGDKEAALARAEDEANRAQVAMEADAAAYAARIAEMDARSQALQAELAELQRTVLSRENADLQAKLSSIQQENTRLMTEAEAARLQGSTPQNQFGAQPQGTIPGSAYPRSGQTVTPPKYGQVTPHVYAPSTYAPPAPVRGGRAWQEPGVDYSMFYDGLSSHGQWLNLEGLGYGFRPRIASRPSWRPYQDGRWVWTNHGWAWDSAEPFGWACYHYGRWVQLSRHGWVWMPGREWAPAWVSWRSSGSHVGWAPLPPSRRRGSWIGDDCDAHYGLAPSHYVFIETRNFNRNTYAGSILPPSNVVQVFSQTINITNIAPVSINQPNVFINRGGPDRRWVEQRLGQAVPVVPVQVSGRLDQSISGLNPRGGGGHSLVAAPLPETGGLAVPPRQVAETIAQASIVDAWSQVPIEQKQDLQDLILKQVDVAESVQPGEKLPAMLNIPGVEAFQQAALERRIQEEKLASTAAATVPVPVPAQETSSITVPNPIPQVVETAEEEAARQAALMAKLEALRLEQAEAIQERATLVEDQAKLQESLAAVAAEKENEEKALREAETTAMTKQQQDLERQKAEALQAANEAEALRQEQEAAQRALAEQEAALAERERNARSEAETTALAKQREDLERQQAEAAQAAKEAETARQAAMATQEALEAEQLVATSQQGEAAR